MVTPFTLTLTSPPSQALGSVAAAKAASLEQRVEIAARDLAAEAERPYGAKAERSSGGAREAAYNTSSKAERRSGSGGGAGSAAVAPAWERALEQEGLQELRYQPGVPKVFDIRVISYNLNALPFGASLLGGPGHDFRDVRLHEFVARPELRECNVLLLQEVFATPVLRGVLCSQAWLRRQLAELGFVHQVVSPRRVSLRCWTDSGLIIASKLPILASGFEAFAPGRHLDAGASKGIMYAKLQVGSRQLFVFNTHLQASHSSGALSYRQQRLEQLHRIRGFVAEAARHSRGVPWLLAGDFNIDAIANRADVSDAFGYLLDATPHESDEYRQMVRTLSGGRGGVRDLLKESVGQHVSTRPPRLQFPLRTEYIFKHKYPQRLDYMFFCDADPRLQPRAGSTELATFACAPPTDGGPQPYTHLSDHYGISTTLRVNNDVCWHHSQEALPPPQLASLPSTYMRMNMHMHMHAARWPPWASVGRVAGALLALLLALLLAVWCGDGDGDGRGLGFSLGLGLAPPRAPELAADGGRWPELAAPPLALAALAALALAALAFAALAGLGGGVPPTVHTADDGERESPPQLSREPSPKLGGAGLLDRVWSRGRLNLQEPLRAPPPRRSPLAAAAADADGADADDDAHPYAYPNADADADDDDDEDDDDAAAAAAGGGAGGAPTLACRSPLAPHELVSEDEQLGVSTVFEALLSSVRRFGPRPCVGVRKPLPDGGHGAYEWSSYDEVYNRVLSVGSALLRLGVARGEGVGILCDNCPEWVVVDQACHAYGLVSVPLWFTVGTEQMEQLLRDSGVVAVVCGERWTGALLRLVRDGRGADVRLLVQREPLRYDEIILKSELPTTSPLKLRDFEFVERMGDCQR